jgi:diguanylate cyclase (GGDEF)-like protein
MLWRRKFFDMVETGLSVKTALVVDDGPAERVAGKIMLGKLGFAVTTATNGEDALRILDQRSIDLVLCDISIPGMCGLDLLDATRNHTQPPIFIMSTDHGDAEHALASLRRGAYGYLTKPLHFDALQRTVADALARYSAEREAALQAAQLAQQDVLTGLFNKDEFARRLRLCLNNTEADTCGAVLLIKVRGLNHINHSHGRSAGDKVLRQLALQLSMLVEPSDLLARFSDDMLSLYLKDVPHRQVEQKAIGVTEQIEDIKMVLEDEIIGIAVSVGGACAHAAMEIDELLNRADFALHLARERSRNHIRIYSEADEVHQRELSHQLSRLALVRAALEDQRRLIMHYQPIVNLVSGHVSHFEALLRLQDENGKFCDTDALVKTCEVFGLIRRLDRAVVGVCLADVTRLPKGCAVAINLSGKSIGDPELLKYIEDSIEALQIDPARIIFELTETAAFYNLDEVRHFVHRIKSLGCRFTLDDFGVGFSSFYYIKELEFDYLKLDGSFIAKLPRNANDQVFVRAMVEISRVFGLQVIAEWVEDRETAELLRGFGVAYGQGDYFGRAAPPP